MDHDSRTMLLETADRFFTGRCGKDVVNGVEKGAWPADLWQEIEDMGLPLIAVPEDKGGVGGTLADMLALLRMAGSHAVPVPLAETALANLLIAAAGGEPKPGPATLVLGNLKLSGGRVSGKVVRVPFAGVAERLVTVVGNALAVVANANARVDAKPSHAGEPYGTVTFDNAATEFSGASPVNAERALELAAVTRAMQMAGAADKRAGGGRQLLDRRRQEPGLGVRPAHRRDLAPVDGRHGLHPRAHPAPLHPPPLGVAPRLRQRDLLGREDRRGLRQGRPAGAVGRAEREQVRGLVMPFPRQLRLTVWRVLYLMQ